MCVCVCVCVCVCAYTYIQKPLRVFYRTKLERDKSTFLKVQEHFHEIVCGKCHHEGHKAFGEGGKILS